MPSPRHKLVPEERVDVLRVRPQGVLFKEEFGWLEGMVSKIRFQLQEWIEPVAVAGKDRRPFVQDGEGGCLLCRHGFELHVMARPVRGDTHTPKACSSWSGLRFYLDTVTRDGGFELRFLPCIRYTDGR